MNENVELTSLVTRGFSSMHEQLRERDGKVGLLSEKMIGVELKIDQLKETLIKVENDIAKTGHENIANRVYNLEAAQKEVKKKQEDTARWLRGLLASVVVLLLGFLLNFIRISVK